MHNREWIKQDRHRKKAYRKFRAFSLSCRKLHRLCVALDEYIYHDTVFDAQCVSMHIEKLNACVKACPKSRKHAKRLICGACG